MRIIVAVPVVAAMLVLVPGATAATAPFYDVTSGGALKRSERARLAVKLNPGVGFDDARWRTISSARGLFEFRGKVAYSGHAANCGLRVEVRGAATPRTPAVRFGTRKPETGSLRAPVPEAFDLASFRFVNGSIGDGVGMFRGPSYDKLEYTVVRTLPVPRGLAARRTSGLVRVDVVKRTFPPVTSATQTLCADAEAGAGVADVAVVRRG